MTTLTIGTSGAQRISISIKYTYLVIADLDGCSLFGSKFNHYKVSQKTIIFPETGLS